MEETAVAAITVKNLGKDEHGLQQYLWATKKQAKRLLNLQFDEEKSHFVYMLGNNSVRPCDILAVKFVKIKEARVWPAFERYVIDELESENKKFLELEESNKKNIERLNELKSAHKSLKI